MRFPGALAPMICFPVDDFISYDDNRNAKSTCFLHISYWFVPLSSLDLTKDLFHKEDLGEGSDQLSPAGHEPRLVPCWAMLVIYY